MTHDESRRYYRWSLVLGFVLFPAPAFALLITLTFQSIPGSVPLTGAGSNNATLNFGRVSAFVLGGWSGVQQVCCLMGGFGPNYEQT